MKSYGGIGNSRVFLKISIACIPLKKHVEDAISINTNKAV